MSKFQKVVAMAIVVATMASLSSTADARPTTARGNAQAVARSTLPATATFADAQPTALIKAAGGWTWWGYRTNSWETWAIATQNPSAVRGMGRFSFLARWTYALGWTWKLTAQNARMMGQCIGIDWAGTGLIVGCSSY